MELSVNTEVFPMIGMSHFFSSSVYHVATRLLPFLTTTAHLACLLCRCFVSACIKHVSMLTRNNPSAYRWSDHWKNWCSYRSLQRNQRRFPKRKRQSGRPRPMSALWSSVHWATTVLMTPNTPACQYKPVLISESLHDLSLVRNTDTNRVEPSQQETWIFTTPTEFMKVCVSCICKAQKSEILNFLKAFDFMKGKKKALR